MSGDFRTKGSGYVVVEARAGGNVDFDGWCDYQSKLGGGGDVIVAMRSCEY